MTSDATTGRPPTPAHDAVLREYERRLARALAMTTYRSDVEFEERFAGAPAVDDPDHAERARAFAGKVHEHSPAAMSAASC